MTFYLKYFNDKFFISNFIRQSLFNHNKHYNLFHFAQKNRQLYDCCKEILHLILIYMIYLSQLERKFSLLNSIIKSLFTFKKIYIKQI